MNELEFKHRTKNVALRVMRLVRALPLSAETELISKELLRTSSFMGAYYRAACRCKSYPDMITKLSLVEQEGDRCLYWLELLIESELIPAQKLDNLMTELNDIVTVTSNYIKTLRTKIKYSQFHQN